METDCSVLSTAQCHTGWISSTTPCSSTETVSSNSDALDLCLQATGCKHGTNAQGRVLPLGNGSNGLRRIIKAGVIPQDMLQRYMNKWVSTAHDLFGVDSSSSLTGHTSGESRDAGTSERSKMLKSTSTRKSSTKKLVATTTMKSFEKSTNSTATKKKVQHRSTSLTRTSTETSVTARNALHRRR